MPEVDPFLFAEAGSFNSPHAYTVPGAGEVQPYTATATYVNNSGQAILPALRLKSASGNLLALVFPATTIANGGSSEVSFVPPFGSAATSSSTPGATDLFWPAAEQASASYDKTTYPNNWSGSGHYDTLVFATNAAAAEAVAVSGDTYPRYVITADPVGTAGGGILMGDGTVDPARFDGVWFGCYPGSGPGLFAMQVGSLGQVLLGSGIDANSGFGVLAVYNGLQLQRSQGSGVRNITQYGGHGVPTIGGNVGDLYWRDDGSAGTYLYRCTVAGGAGAATWGGIL